jgi:hypothetical protein
MKKIVPLGILFCQKNKVTELREASEIRFRQSCFSEGNFMPRLESFSALTVQRKFDIALDVLCSRLTTAAVCCKHGISASCASRIKDCALEVLRAGIGQSVSQANLRSERLLKRLDDLEQLVCDQALAIDILRKHLRNPVRPFPTPSKILASPNRQCDSAVNQLHPTISFPAQEPTI